MAGCSEQRVNAVRGKEYARRFYVLRSKAPTHDSRQSQLPTDLGSCGNQPANIRLINRRILPVRPLLSAPCERSNMATR